MFSEFEGWFKEELERRGLPGEPPEHPRTDPTPEEVSMLVKSTSATVGIKKRGYFPATIRIEAKAHKILKVASGLGCGQYNVESKATGTLKFIDWKFLMEKRNAIFVTGTGGGLKIIFSVDNRVVAIFEGEGAGNLESNLMGWVDWMDTLESE